MERCQFSETQFEAYHSRAFERIMPVTFPQFFPTRAQEGRLGFDMMHRGTYTNYFFQYKVPVSYKTKPNFVKGAEYDPDSNWFQIHLSNSGGSKSLPQYNMLKRLSHACRHVYYVAPVFNTATEFSNRYLNILQHTALFHLSDPVFPAPSNTKNHHIYYNDKTNLSYIRSEPRKIDRLRNVVDYRADKKDIRQFVTNTIQILQRLFAESAKPELAEELRSYTMGGIFEKQSFEHSILMVDLFLQRNLNVHWMIGLDDFSAQIDSLTEGI